MDLQLTGKIAFVSGSTGGIGEAIAIRLSEEGGWVIVHGRRQQEAQRVVDLIKKRGGTAAIAVGDLSLDGSASTAVASALAAYGRIDIIVNNAATFANDDWEKLNIHDWINQYNTNVVSAIRVFKGVLPSMRAQGWGRIIQIGSVGGTMPSATTVAYGGTKSAIAALSVGLSKVLTGSGITVNTVSPGPILTPMLENWIQEIASSRGWPGDMHEWERKFSSEVRPNTVGRVGRVDEIADVVAFLASPRSGFINGANIRVDGGLIPTI